MHISFYFRPRMQKGKKKKKSQTETITFACCRVRSRGHQEKQTSPKKAGENKHTWFNKQNKTEQKTQHSAVECVESTAFG